MKRLSFVLLGAVLVLGPGCGQKDEVQGREFRRETLKKPVAKITRKYDADGELLESEFKFGEIPLPMGLAEHNIKAKEFVFYTRLDPAKLTRYFVARLSAKEIKPLGEGALLKGARYTPLGDTSPIYDVSIVRADVDSRVELRLVPEAPTTGAATPEDLQKMMKEAWLRGE